MDKIGGEYMRETGQVEYFGDKVAETRQRWQKKRGRLQRRFMDGMKEDTQRAGVTEDGDSDSEEFAFCW